MLVSPKNSYAEILSPSVMVRRWGLWKVISMKVVPSWMGLVPFWEEMQKRLSFFLQCEDTRRQPSINQEKGLHQGPNYASTLISNTQLPEVYVCCLSQPIYGVGILLQQTKLTQVAITVLDARNSGRIHRMHLPTHISKGKRFMYISHIMYKSSIIPCSRNLKRLHFSPQIMELSKCSQFMYYKYRIL